MCLSLSSFASVAAGWRVLQLTHTVGALSMVHRHSLSDVVHPSARAKPLQRGEADRLAVDARCTARPGERQARSASFSKAASTASKGFRSSRRRLQRVHGSRPATSHAVSAPDPTASSDCSGGVRRGRQQRVDARVRGQHHRTVGRKPLRIQQRPPWPARPGRSRSGCWTLRGLKPIEGVIVESTWSPANSGEALTICEDIVALGVAGRGRRVEPTDPEVNHQVTVRPASGIP